MNSTASLMVYLLSMAMILNASSMMMLWVMLEINMMMFIFMSVKSISMMGSEKIMKEMFLYFIYQSLGSILLIISMTKELSSESSNNILTLSLAIKMGLVPFQSWLFKISQNMSPMNLTVLLTLQKVPMIMVASFMEKSNAMMEILILSTTTGSLMMWNSTEIKKLVVSSSIYFNIWLIMTSKSSINMLTLGMAMYVLSTWMLLHLQKTEWGMVTIMMFFLGLPPMGLFFMKLFITSTLMYTGFTVVGIMWISSMLANASYMKIMSNWMFWKNTNNKENKMSNSLAKNLMMAAILMIMISC